MAIALAMLVPILTKYLRNLSVMSMRSVIVFPSDFKRDGEGIDGLFLRLFITSFSSFHVFKGHFWHLLAQSRNMYA